MLVLVVRNGRLGWGQGTRGHHVPGTGPLTPSLGCLSSASSEFTTNCRSGRGGEVTLAFQRGHTEVSFNAAHTSCGVSTQAGHSMDCPPPTQAPWHPGTPWPEPRGCTQKPFLGFLPYHSAPSATAVSPLRLAKKQLQSVRRVDLIPWQRKSVQCLLGRPHLVRGRVGEGFHPCIFGS